VLGKTPDAFPGSTGQCKAPLLRGLFFGTHRTHAERLGTVAEENQGARADIGELVVFFGRQKHDVVLFEKPLKPVNGFDRALAGALQPGFTLEVQ
jgi:hypothetical protein